MRRIPKKDDDDGPFLDRLWETVMVILFYFVYQVMIHTVKLSFQKVKNVVELRNKKKEAV